MNIYLTEIEVFVLKMALQSAIKFHDENGIEEAWEKTNELLERIERIEADTHKAGPVRQSIRFHNDPLKDDHGF